MAEFQDSFDNCNGEELELKLFQACSSSQDDEVYFLLSCGVNIDVQDEDGRTALMLSSMCGNVTILKYLVSNGADLNLRDKSGETALMFACVGGCSNGLTEKCVDLLLKGGADVNARSGCGETALLKVCEYDGSVGVVRMLLEKDANANWLSHCGTSALMRACEKGSEEIVRVLIDHGVDVNVKNGEGDTALMLASIKGHVRTVECLLEHCTDLIVSGCDGDKALKLACEHRLDKIVDLLIARGIDLNVGFWGETTSFIMACKNGQDEFVEVLLERGVNVNEADRQGVSVLMKASENGHVNVCRLLVERGVDVNAGDINGMSALMMACKAGHFTVCKLLVDNGADVKARDKNMGTALMEACKKGHFKIVELLLRRGAYVDSRDETGLTVLMRSCENGHEEVGRLLVKFGADLKVRNWRGRTVLMEAVKNGLVALVKLLIECGVDVNMKDHDGNTALLSLWAYEMKFSSWRGNGYLDSLLNHQGKINIPKEDIVKIDEKTRQKIVKLLVQGGADVNVQTRDEGLSVLMVAARSGDATCLGVLLMASSNLDLVDKSGSTVFSHAMNNHNPECLKQLLVVQDRLVTCGRLSHVHRTAKNTFHKFQPLLLLVNIGLFEWDLLPIDLFKVVSVAAMKSGYCPGKVKQSHTCRGLSPLVIAFLGDYKHLIKSFLTHLFFFPEDYITLSSDRSMRRAIPNTDLLHKFTCTPMTLEAWSILAISKCVSLSGSPACRRLRVETLKIPKVFKSRLLFDI